MAARWGARVLIALLWLLHFLPLPLLAALGQGLGGLLWRGRPGPPGAPPRQPGAGFFGGRRGGALGARPRAFRLAGPQLPRAGPAVVCLGRTPAAPADDQGGYRPGRTQRGASDVAAAAFRRPRVDRPGVDAQPSLARRGCLPAPEQSGLRCPAAGWSRTLRQDGLCRPT